MFKNYLHIALRTLKNNRLFTLLNILGLGFGLSCIILIGLWIHDEYSFDKFHSKSDHIYLLVQEISSGSNQQFWANSPARLAQVLMDEVPQVEYTLRLNEMASNFKVGDSKVKMTGLYVDSVFFDVFDFKLQAGNSETALADPYNVVISERLAYGLFNRTDVIGQTVTVLDNKIEEEYTVSGVLSEVPSNSSLKFDYLIPSRNFYVKRPYYERWGNFNGPIYITLKQGASVKETGEMIKNLIAERNEGSSVVTHLYPFKDVYLKSDFSQGLDEAGRIVYVRILIIVAVILLIIAIINFVNLTTALADKRGKEVGVRKTVGAVRGQLIPQFIGESILVTLFSFFMALVMSSLLLPVFSNITGKQITLPIGDPLFIIILVLGVVVVGLLAGAYPAYYLSGYDINTSLKKGKSNKSLTSLRIVMVVFQFVMSISLIIGALFIKDQVSYFMKKDLGVKTSDILYHLNYDISSKTETYRNQLKNIPGVKDVAFASFSPLNIGNTTYSITWEGSPDNSGIYFHTMHVDHNFPELFDLEFKQGKAFTPEFNEENIEFILNETAVRSMMLTNSIGSKMTVWGQEGTVVGVVNDFHHQNLAQSIEPVILFHQPSSTSRTFIEVESQNMETVLPEIERLFASFNSAYSFEYTFLDENIKKEYGSISAFGNLINAFSWVTIIVSCLGLFGLSAFLMAQRKKETGIRKALGASVGELFQLFSFDFMKLILVAFVIAAPITGYFINNWLDGFAYRIDLEVLPFIIGGLASIFIAMLSVSYNILKTSYLNPTTELRAD